MRAMFGVGLQSKYIFFYVSFMDVCFFSIFPFFRFLSRKFEINSIIKSLQHWNFKFTKKAERNLIESLENFLMALFSHFTFCSLFETTQTLFWAVFGLVDLDSFELEGIKIFTRFWGMLMFGTYSVINIVVLLNLLIAMMNHSYQLISVSYICYLT